MLESLSFCWNFILICLLRLSNLYLDQSYWRLGFPLSMKCLTLKVFTGMVSKRTLRTIVSSAFYLKFLWSSNLLIAFAQPPKTNWIRINLVFELSVGRCCYFSTILKPWTLNNLLRYMLCTSTMPKLLIKCLSLFQSTSSLSLVLTTIFPYKWSLLWMVDHKKSQSMDIFSLQWASWVACHKAQVLILFSSIFLMTSLRSSLMLLHGCLLMTLSFSSIQPFFMMISPDYTSGTYLPGCWLTFPKHQRWISVLRPLLHWRTRFWRKVRGRMIWVQQSLLT